MSNDDMENILFIAVISAIFFGLLRFYLDCLVALEAVYLDI